ncbi:MAG: universal stress protein [Gammaproteobacteria bacterium]|nr:universal stress protein [Pseudomonadales bacterium]MCP5345426.1 universal stress protein [Pseudomonadales bacterium]
MQSFNRILVVLDGYEELPAGGEGLPIEVTKALHFVSDKQESEIFLLSCGYEKFLHDSYYSFGDEMKELREEHCRRLEDSLARVAGQLRDQGYQVQSEMVWAFPRYEQIVRKSIDYSVDLIVQHTRAYAKMARAFLTNDSWQLVRFSPKPLLLVKDRAWSREPVILAGVDPVHSHHKPLQLDHKIISTALGIGAQLGGAVHVLHAYAEIGRPFALPDKVLKAHEHAFEELLADFSLDAENCHLVDESPVFALQNYEQKLGSDIIVMGALSRSRLADVLIGNTAEKVLDYLDSDVLIVKPRSIT